jgi:hypothetical protein
MVYYYDSKCHSSGYYPTEEFIILDPPPNPTPKENGSIFSWFSTKLNGSEAITTNPLHEVVEEEETGVGAGIEVRSVVGVVPSDIDFSEIKSTTNQSSITTPQRPIRNDLRDKFGMTPDKSNRLSTSKLSLQPVEVTPAPPLHTPSPALVLAASGNGNGNDRDNGNDSNMNTRLLLPTAGQSSYTESVGESKDDEIMLTDRSYVSSAQNPRPRDLADKLVADQEARQSLLSTKQQNLNHSSISMKSLASSRSSVR